MNRIEELQSLKDYLNEMRKMHDPEAGGEEWKDWDEGYLYGVARV